MCNRRTRRNLRAGLTLAVLAAVLGACGSDDPDKGPSDSDATRTVEVKMVDVAFKPDRISVAKGEEMRFRFTNEGKVRHEGYVGTPEEQVDHEKEMVEGDGGGHNEHAGDDDRKVKVEPGKRGEITYRFAEAGTFEIGCHEPGHYEAGMKITVDVA